MKTTSVEHQARKQGLPSRRRAEPKKLWEHDGESSIE